jgi:hypothetical protein
MVQLPESQVHSVAHNLALLALQVSFLGTFVFPTK